MGLFSKPPPEPEPGKPGRYQPRHAGKMALKSGKMTPRELGKHRRPGDLNGITDDDVFGWVGND